MKIVFLTQEDPLYILPFFEEFFRQDLGEIKVLAIFTCKTMGERGRLKLLRELLHLYGPLGLTRLLARMLKSRLLSLLPASKSSKKFYSIRQICKTLAWQISGLGIPIKSSIALTL